jgi:stringent starvation protein B
MKPIQTAIESLQAKGLCPRLHVDVTHKDAVLPDFVRDKWKQRLVIDLDPSYPLDLAFTAVGVEADLSFGGYVTRCTFPWAAIYVVADRGTGRGQVFADNIPDSLRHQYAAPAPQAPAPGPALTSSRDDTRPKTGSRRHRRAGAEPPVSPPQGVRPLAPVLAPVEDASEVEETPAEAAVVEVVPSGEQTAQKRRSAFKVIDGGN